MNNLTAIISADNTQFVKSVSEAKSMLDKYTKSSQATSDEIKKNCSVTDAQVESYRRVVKQFEKVNSGTMTTAQQTKALENQIKELKIQWANLSNEAKKSDFGKSISSSLSSAQKNLEQLRTQLKQTGDSMKTTSKSNDLFGVSITNVKGLLTKLAPALGAVKLAQIGWNEALSNNESLADSVGSSMRVLNSAVDGFFSAITTGNFSGFLSGMDDIVVKAKAAYAALDDLGTFKAFFGSANSKLDFEIEELRNQLTDPNLSKDDQKKLAAQLEAKLKERRKLNEDLAAKELNNYYTQGAEYLAKNGLTGATKEDVDEFFGSYYDFSSKVEEMKAEAEKLKNDPTRGVYMKQGSWNRQLGDYNYTQEWHDQDAKKRYNQLQNLIKGISEEEVEKIKAYEQAYWAAKQGTESYERGVKRQLNKANAPTKTTGGKTTTTPELPAAGSLDDAKKKVKDLQKELDNIPFTIGEENAEWNRVNSELQVAKVNLAELEKQQSAINKPVEIQATGIKAIKDRISELKKKLEELPLETEEQIKAYVEVNNELKKEEEHLAKVESQIKAINAVPKNAIEQKVETYETKQTEVKNIVSYNQMGIIDTKEARKQIDEINKQLEAVGLNPIKVKLEGEIDIKVDSFTDKLKKDMDNAMTYVDGLSTGVGAIDNIYKSFKNLDDELANAENGWEGFMAVFDATMSVVQGAASIIEAVTTVTSLFTGATEALTAAKSANAAATAAEASAETTEAGAAMTSAGAALTAAAAKGTETAANTAAAASGAASSVASIPYVGPILAVAAVATILGVILAAVSKSKATAKFANGGIVAGGSNVGDFNLARVNGGEMILNGTQQKRLFQVLNGSGTAQTTGTPQVEFKIKGQDLVGTINNYNKKKSRV